MKGFVIIPLIVLILSGTMAYLTSCGYVGADENQLYYKAEYEEGYPFTYNSHTYLRFGWSTTQTVVHDPECICLKQHDYQIDFNNDSTNILYMGRVVKTFKFGQCKQLDSVFLKNNQ